MRLSLSRSSVNIRYFGYAYIKDIVTFVKVGVYFFVEENVNIFCRVNESTFKMNV